MGIALLRLLRFVVYSTAFRKSWVIFMAVILHKQSTAALAISAEERDFFVALGERIAALRKAHNIT